VTAADLKCPNCGSAGVAGKQTGELVCSQCGGTFTFKEGEARLAGLDEYDQLKGKVEQLETHQVETDELLSRMRPKDDHPDHEDPDEEVETEEEEPNDNDFDEDEDW
jgi:transcription elongation factor Elf1